MKGKNPMYDREMTPEEKRDTARINKFINKPEHSQYQFSDGMRTGILTDGITHKNIIELVRKHRGDDLANKCLTIKPACASDDVNFIHQIVWYYMCAANAVLHEFRKEGETCLHSFESYIDNPYGPAALANFLHRDCGDYLEAFEKRYSEGTDENSRSADDETVLWFSSKLLQICQRYCNLQISLLERTSLLKMKDGAAVRSSDNEDAYRTTESLRIATDYINHKKTVGPPATYRGVANHVKKLYVPDMDEKAPSRNTLKRWLNREGIFL